MLLHSDRRADGVLLEALTMVRPEHDLVPKVVSQPGDWDYDADRNADYTYNPEDLYSDLYAVMNVERLERRCQSG